MPNKTIYVKEEYLPLYEKVQAAGGGSISTKFVEFLKFEDSLSRPGNIQMLPMPEMSTLRDQFAMAAMIADSVQSAIVAAAYIGQGKVFSGEIPGQADEANEYYKVADAMLEARKQ